MKINKSPIKIKAVIFDFGLVLIAGDWQAIYKIIAKKLKTPLTKFFEINKPLLEQWNIGKINETIYWRELEKKTGKKLPPDFKKNLWFRIYEKGRKDIKGTWKVLPELKKRGLRLTILSNTIPLHVKANKKIGRIKRLKKLGFKILIWSCEVGCRKPHPRIYKITLKRLNLPAKECVFVDDRIENVKAAEKLGMAGIHFKNPKQLRKGLIKLGLL